MLIKCTIEHTVLAGDYSDYEGGYVDVEGLTATCSRCGHQTESFGTSDASKRRCLVLLKEDCPRKGNHFYVDKDDQLYKFGKKVKS